MEQVAKVRLQILDGMSVKNSATGLALHSQNLTPQYRGLFGTLFGMIRNEGIRSLYGGISPGLQRQCVFASIRIGLYDPVKGFYSNHLNLGEF
jgi:solute carrier family 25 uncoupling protein 8/9